MSSHESGFVGVSDFRFLVYSSVSKGILLTTGVHTYCTCGYILYVPVAPLSHGGEREAVPGCWGQHQVLADCYVLLLYHNIITVCTQSRTVSFRGLYVGTMYRLRLQAMGWAVLPCFTVSHKRERWKISYLSLLSNRQPTRSHALHSCTLHTYMAAREYNTFQGYRN